MGSRGRRDIPGQPRRTEGRRNVAYGGGIQDWLRDEDVPNVDVVLGGPPCQGFSALGRQDVNDERNFLWRHYAETIFRAQPKYFVMENVREFLTSPELAMFQRETEAGLLANYTFEARVLNAADYGAAQVRRRAIVIGRRRDMPPVSWPEVTHPRGSWVKVRTALRWVRRHVRHSGMPSAPGYSFQGETLPGPWNSRQSARQPSLHRPVAQEVRAHSQGWQPTQPARRSFSSPCWRKHKTGASDVMGRLWWDRPSVTIRTEFFKPEKGRYLHPTENRAITHFEASRLQGFPDDYRWVGTKTHIARQIGNAVPIPLGRALGRVDRRCTRRITGTPRGRRSRGA